MRVTWVLPLALGCRALDEEPPVHEGIAVGNPTNLAVELRIAPNQTWAMDKLVWNTEFSLLDAQGAETRLGESEVDLLAGETFEATVAPWSALRLDGAAPMNAHGTTESGAPVHLVLGLDGLELSLDPGDTSASAYVLELGAPDWLTLAPDADRVNIARGHPAHDEVVADLVEGTRLYPDLDGDGIVSDAERDLGVGSPTPYADPANDR